MGEFGASFWQWPMSGGPDFWASGLITLAMSSRWMPEGTGMPAGTSAVSSVDETKVVGRTWMTAAVVASESSSWAPGWKSLAEELEAEARGVVEHARPDRMEHRRGAGGGVHVQFGRQSPGQLASAGGSHCSPGSSTPSPQTGTGGSARKMRLWLPTATRAPARRPTKVARERKRTRASGASTVARTSPPERPTVTVRVPANSKWRGLPVVPMKLAPSVSCERTRTVQPTAAWQRMVAPPASAIRRSTA